MKLAEALILRADCNKKLMQLISVLEENAKVQEGESPTRQPEELVQEYIDKNEEMCNLVKKINKTNMATAFDGNMTLSDALAQRDKLTNELNMMQRLVVAASVRQDLYSRSEIKFVRTIDVNQYQKKIEQLSKQYRELDTKIQAMNWNADLL